MKKIQKIIEINVLSIIALPLLLLATAAKLAAKAMEKAVTIIGAVFILLGISLIFELCKNPSGWLEGIGIVIICLVLGGIFIAIAIWILGIISGAVAVVVAVIIALLNGIYELIYGGYVRLYHKCKLEYAIVEQDSNGLIIGLSCLFFTLLRMINRAIILFVTHAIKVFALGSVAIVIGSLVLCNRHIQSQFGIHLLAYIKLFPMYSIVYGVVMYLAVIAAVVIILMSLGLEWSEWGSEMDIFTSDYQAFVDSVSGIGELHQESLQDMQGIDEKRLEKCRRYQEMIQRHASEFGEFADEMEPIVQRSENYILRSSLGEYFTKLQDTVNLLNKYVDGVSVEEFEKIIPQIDRLEELKRAIEKQAFKEATRLKNSAAVTGGGFFAGCDTLEKLEKRYRALCKTYHPDCEAGDVNTFKVMTAEYEKLKEKLKG